MLTGMTESDGPRLHTLAEAATRLRISRSKLYKLMDAGQLRSIKLGTRRLISEDALTEFIAELEAER